MKRHKNFSAPLILFFAFFWHPFAFAQETNNPSLRPDASENLFYIELSPEFPGPGEKVTASINSFTFDVNAALITWIHNEKVTRRGIGIKTYEFVAGVIGQLETIKVVAEAKGFGEQKATKAFRISDVDLTWLSNSIIPPEYRGKAFPGPRSRATVTAFPQFLIGTSPVNPNSLMYEWFIDGDRRPEASGFGKRSINFTTSLAGGISHQVKVTVSNIEKTIVRNKIAFVPVREPEVLIYEEETAGGPNMSRAVTSSKMFPGEEKKFRVLPYFFSENSRNLNFKWTVNNDEVTDDKSPDVLSVKLTDDAAGLVNINALVESVNNIIQRARASFVINIL